MKNVFLISVILCLLSGALNAQKRNPEPVLIKGRVVTAVDAVSGIPYAHIYNRQSEKGTTSDPGGNFRLMASPGDSIEFRMVGYVDTLLSFQQIKALQNIIPLRERTYRLRQVKVSGNRFQKSFAPAQPSSDPYVGYRSVKPSGRSRQEDEIGTGAPTVPGTGIAITGAATAFANLFNEKEQQRVRIRELKEQDRIKQYYKALFEYWFDKEIVAEITGLRGSELNRFIKFCSPSLSFLEEATEYEVITAIQKYHRQYQNINRY